MNNLDKLFDFVQLLQKLKENKRWGNTSTFIKKESIADHVWKATVMVFLVYKNMDLKLDLLKILKIALVHDLVEAIAGDTDYHLVYTWQVSKEEKYQNELKSINEIIAILPEKSWKEIYDLWIEYENWDTEEAKFVKLVEKIESIDHVINNWHQCIDIPDK
ncbi:MAG: hypothetical protein ACD_4C00032G0005, partial [uncultured bacterium (gcode 4)]